MSLLLLLNNLDFFKFTLSRFFKPLMLQINRFCLSLGQHLLRVAAFFWSDTVCFSRFCFQNFELIEAEIHFSESEMSVDDERSHRDVISWRWLK